VDDGKLAILEQSLKPRHAAVEAAMVVNLQQLVRRDADLRAQFVVGVVRKGDKRVQAIVGA